MPAPQQPRLRPEPPEPEYVYRRRLAPRELLPAVGAGVGVGLVAFYVARLFLQRTPIDVATSQPPHRGRRPDRG